MTTERKEVAEVVENVSPSLTIVHRFDPDEERQRRLLRHLVDVSSRAAREGERHE